MLLNVQELRSNFPILQRGIIYLDTAASSLTPEPVLQKMLEFYHEYRANVGRGVFSLTLKATEEYESARGKIANFVGAKSKSEIFYTRNTTEGINIIANGLKWKRGGNIVTSLIEHHSNFVVWLRVKQQHQMDLEIVRPCEPEIHGLLDPADFEKVVDDNTRLVAITQVSNALGTVEPVKEIAEIAHEHGAYVLVDGAQSVPHMKVDVKDIKCDFLAFSGHKMCGPPGSGALYVREELADEIQPSYVGGGAIEEVGTEYYTLADGPQHCEAGTPAIADEIALGAAIEYLERIGMQEIEEYEKKLGRKMYEGLAEIPSVEMFGPEPGFKVGILAFNLSDSSSDEVARRLDQASILVRSGHHCTLPLMREVLRRSGTVRASTYFYNTEEEVERLVSTVEKMAGTRV